MSQDQIKKGMILCAGLGTRLLPITKTLPKPLVPVLNVENVLYNIRLLEAAGVEEIMVNLHHLPDGLKSFLSSSKRTRARLSFSYEPEILGTGGGVKKVETFFNGEAFILANCDFITNIDLRAVVAEHKAKKNLATMVLIQDEQRQRKYSKVGFDEKMRLCSLPKLQGKAATKFGIFTGLHVIESECLKYLKEEPCGINDLMYPALMKKHSERVGVYVDLEHYWYDTGEVDTFLESTRGLLAELKKGGEFQKTFSSLYGRTLNEYQPGVWAEPELEIPEGVSFMGNALLGSDLKLHGELLIGPNVVIADGCSVTGPAKLSDCVLLSGAVIKGGDVRESILYQDMVLKPPTK